MCTGSIYKEFSGYVDLEAVGDGLKHVRTLRGYMTLRFMISGPCHRACHLGLRMSMLEYASS